MNIALRPSGGRGEYELAGSQGLIRPHDLFGLRIHLETIPGTEINTLSECRKVDGKPRIRLESPTRNAHPALVIAGSMLLPKPRRKRADARGTELITRNGYVVQLVRVDVVDHSGTALLRPVMVRLENNNDDRVDIDYSERMARVVRVWAAAATGSSPLDLAVQNHGIAFGIGSASHKAMISAAQAIAVALKNPQNDLLPILERQYGLAVSPRSVGDLSTIITDADYDEAVTITPEEARVARVKQWRLANVRGKSAALFRREVRDAYDHRCLISGVRLPPTDIKTKAGVDAAHILPWSKYDLDKTSNGLCLSKQCHWAFDEGILRLRYDLTSSLYIVSIPPEFKAAASRAALDLPTLEAYEGPIPSRNLPSTRASWPSTIYLDQLNRFLDGLSP